MNLGFEFAAAKPKTPSEDDQPYAESMRGQRKITSNPSTDQKKVRRAQQRKQAELNEYELEVEAGIRDWFNRFKTPTDPVKGSGIFPDKCENCGGHGYEPTDMSQECRNCSGQGESFPQSTPDVHVQRPSSEPARHGGTCTACNGSGQGFYGESCPSCRGIGRTAAKSTCTGCGETMIAPKGKSAKCGNCQGSDEWKSVTDAVDSARKDIDKKSALDDTGGKCPLCDDPLPKGANGTVNCSGCGKDIDVQPKEKTARRSGGSEFTYMNAIARRAKSVLDTEEK